MIPIPEFDEFHSVSDLHMGGAPGFQIFDQGALLAALIEALRDRPAPESRVALLVNGDMIDFLAEPDARYFDPLGAADKLNRIAGREAFAPVFAALARFVSKPNRHLIVTLGNHDIELALPWVRARLLEILSGGDHAARGRITLSFEGAGYACSVGGAGILAAHGNEVDPWNITDFETLRRFGRDGLQSRPLEEWTPNAGTKMVIDVMNGIKQKYAFVDLLKPEVEAVIPILVALDQAQASRLARIAAVAAHLTWDKVRKATGFLSAGEEAETASVALDERANPAGALDRILNRTFRGDGKSTGPRGEPLLDYVDSLVDRKVDPLELLEGSEATEQLGVFGAAWDYIRRKPQEEVLLEALQGLKRDRSFELGNRDETYQRLDQFVGAGFDYLFAGHTHLERVISRSAGRGSYLNTGTWVGLMRFTEEQLSSVDQFRPVWAAIRKASTMAGLSDYIERRPAVVSVRREAGTTRGVLQRVSRKGDDVVLTPVTGS
jgi:UDP-2,3-diacylglucosamine pyrophosphatase LpxH